MDEWDQAWKDFETELFGNGLTPPQQKAMLDAVNMLLDAAVNKAALLMVEMVKRKVD